MPNRLAKIEPEVLLRVPQIVVDCVRIVELSKAAGPVAVPEVSVRRVHCWTAAADPLCLSSPRQA